MKLVCTYNIFFVNFMNIFTCWTSWSFHSKMKKIVWGKKTGKEMPKMVHTTIISHWHCEIHTCVEITVNLYYHACVYKLTVYWHQHKEEASFERSATKRHTSTFFAKMRFGIKLFRKMWTFNKHNGVIKVSERSQNEVTSLYHWLLNYQIYLESTLGALIKDTWCSFLRSKVSPGVNQNDIFLVFHM